MKAIVSKANEITNKLYSHTKKSNTECYKTSDVLISRIDFLSSRTESIIKLKIKY